MKKTLLLFAMLLSVVGAWAQTPVLTYTNITAPQELSAEDAKTIREMSAMTIVAEVDITDSNNTSLLFAAVADVTKENTTSQDVWGLGIGANTMRHYVSIGTGHYYSATTVSTNTKQIAYVYNGGLTYYSDATVSKSLDAQNVKALNKYVGETTKFYLGGMEYNTSQVWGTFNGTIHSVRIYDKALTKEEFQKVKYVKEVEEFQNGFVYTFKTSLGWMGAKDDSDKLISTAYAKNNITGDKDNANFQWTVYKSPNNKYYLYNLGKKQFMGTQSSGNAAIPFVETPSTLNLTFKTSGKTDYPIMFSSDGKGVVNHSKNFEPGLINWSSGWANLNDAGNNHQIENVGVLDSKTLQSIEDKVLNFEWTTFSNNLTDIYEKLQAIDLYNTTYVGTSVGQYNWDVDDFNTLEGISQFMVNLPNMEKTSANSGLIYKKLSEAENLINKFNLPVAGKFYRIKAVSGWNNDAPYLGAKNSTAKTGRAEYVSYNAENNKAESANTIFYYNGTGLVSYGSGNYLVNNSGFLGYNGIQTSGIDVTFSAASKGTIGAYNISFYGGARKLFVNQSNYTDAGSSTDEQDGYCFNIEEVEYLPVPMNVNATYATLYSPVALSTYQWKSTSTHRVEAYVGTINNNGKFSMVRIDAEDGVIPANTPVVLKYVADAETVDNNSWVFLAVSDSDKETPENNELNGTFADAYITDDAYVLSYVNVAEDGQPEEKEIGFYTATKNQQNGASWLNNGFKAYLPKPEASEARFFVFDFGGNETGIESVEGENGNVETENSEVYDLSGRRVLNAKKGIFVINGKVVVK